MCDFYVKVVLNDVFFVRRMWVQLGACEVFLQISTNILHWSPADSNLPGNLPLWLVRPSHIFLRKDNFFYRLVFSSTTARYSFYRTSTGDFSTNTIHRSGIPFFPWKFSANFLPFPAFLAKATFDYGKVLVWKEHNDVETCQVSAWREKNVLLPF